MLRAGNLVRHVLQRRVSTANVVQHPSWKVVRTQTLSEFNIEATELMHSRSGAKLLHFGTDDQMNAFSVNFRTIPHDSTGVAHILEHISLCGSKNYPVRDPFFKMLGRSLSSFMNAMTAPDCTFYPFSTQNEKDFYNLMSVYLDAVFRPNLKELDFLQEGWRLEPKDPNDPNSELVIKGVVFNEMKGVFADPQQLLGRYMLSALLPSDTYGHCSGGIPKDIPKLSWEQLKNFHQQHYNPKNARFITYGDIPLRKHLDEIDQYLEQIKTAPNEVPGVKNEPRWSEPRTLNLKCAPNPGDAKSSTLTVSFLACDINDAYEAFVLQIVSELLIDGANSLFYKNFIESGKASSFAPCTGFETQTKDNFFTVGLQGVAEDKMPELEQAIADTFNQAVNEGFDKDRVEAILHRTELSLKNKSNKFGIGIIMSLYSSWNHSVSDPLESLKFNSKIERFRKDYSANPKLLEEYVQKYFVQNQHKLTIRMVPDEGFAAQEEQVLNDLQANLANRLTKQERETILEKTRLLKEDQDCKEDLNCLPTLRTSDIVAKAPRYSVAKSTIVGVPVQMSEQPTNEVAFFRALVSTNNLPDDLKPVLPLFTSFLSSLGAGKFDYKTLDTEVNLRTGGLGSSVHISESPVNVNTLTNGVLLSSHCLEKNTDRMFELWQEIFTDLRVNEPDRLRALIRMHATNAMNGVIYQGHAYAMGASASTLQPGPYQKETNGGLNIIRFLNKAAAQEGVDVMIDSLAKVAKLVLNKKHMKVALNTSPNHAEKFTSSTETFLNSISGDFEDFSSSNYDEFQPKSHKIFYATPFPVHFCSTSLPSVGFTHPDFAAVRIMARLLSMKYLHVEIREKGGAYGGGMTSNSAGVLSFYSYRDPNCQATLDTFDKSLDWIRAGQFGQQDVDEAKLGVFQKIDEPTVPGNRGLRPFLSDITDDMFDEHRAALKAVTLEDVNRVAEKYLNPSVRGTTVIGPESQSLDSTWEVKTLI